MSQHQIGIEPYGRSYLTLKEARESWDHAICNEFIYLFQPCEVALDSLVGIPKCYVDGSHWIECHITFQIQRNDHHFCVVIESDLRDKLTREFWKPEINNCALDWDSSVFVDITKQAKLPQVMTGNCFGIPSVVRLKRFNDGDCICGYIGSVLREFSGIRGSEDRELGSLGIRTDLLSERPNKLIQRTSETIQEITNNQCDLVWQVLDLKAENIQSIFSIFLASDRAGFRFPENPNPFPQFLKVFFRPCGFEIGIS